MIQLIKFNIKSLNISTATNQLIVSQLITEFIDVAPIKLIQNKKSQEECIQFETYVKSYGHVRFLHFK